MELTDKQNIELLRGLSPRPLVSSMDSEALFVQIEEIKKIRLAIETNENVLIIGERGSGKTSLMNHLYNIYNKTKEEQKIVPVRFNAMLINEFNQTNFLETLINNIFDSIMKFQTRGEKLWSVLEKTISVPDKNYKFFPITLDGNIRSGKKDADFELLTNRLEKLVHTLQKRGIHLFVILDDTDKFRPKVIWNTFRGMRDMLWDLRISFIFSALPNQVSELTKPPLDQFFPYWIKIKPFDEIMIKELLHKRAKYAHAKIELDDEALMQITTETKGNPRTILSMMKNVIESEQYGNPITLDDIEKLGLPYSSALNKIERATVNYLAENPYVSASSVDFSKNLNLTRSRIAQILNDLKEQGLVDSRKEGKKVVYYITKKGILEKTKKQR